MSDDKVVVHDVSDPESKYTAWIKLILFTQNMETVTKIIQISEFTIPKDIY